MRREYVWVMILAGIAALAMGVIAYYSFTTTSVPTSGGGSSSSSSSFPSNVAICVYGAHGCPHCDRFRAWLGSVGANFKFCDVETNATCLQTAKELVRDLGVPPAIPMSIVRVKLSKPIDGHDVFVFMLIGEFEHSKVWFELRPKVLSNGTVLIPKYASLYTVKYTKYDWSYVPMYESSGGSVKLAKELSISPAKMLQEFSCRV